MSRRLEPLTPPESRPLGLYVCGPTVYDYAHVGHMRSVITYDLLVRHLRASRCEVTYVRNITDIDDKIVRRAAERGEPPQALAQRFEQAFHEDTRKLGLIEADHEPRVSDNL